MNHRAGDWSARVRVRTPSEASAGRLLRALAPESVREVPRTRIRIARSGRDGIELQITAPATGALRAALNTHLGWVQLALSTERVGELSSRSTPPSVPAGEALI